MGTTTTARKRVALDRSRDEIARLLRGPPLVARERHPLTNDRPSDHLLFHVHYRYLVTRVTARRDELIGPALARRARRQRRALLARSVTACFSRHFGPGPRI
jgi:hypothetical protein